jgi:hypothetical protein
MPEGLDFEELSSDYLFSLDLDALCGLDDVRTRFRFSRCSFLTIRKPVGGFDKPFQPIDRSIGPEDVEKGPFVSEPWKIATMHWFTHH